NGKGSTAAMTASIAQAAGLRTGLYTSPHLVNITERIRVNFKPITPTNFARLATEVRAASEALVAEGALPAPPTFFEQVTMIGFLHFAERQVDLAVLEVGLGGRLDATNICEPVVTAITPLGMDHQQYLGDTPAAIAGEKAGIIKPGVPLIVAPQEDEAMAVIKARAAELSAPLDSVSESVRLSDCEPHNADRTHGSHFYLAAAGQYGVLADTASGNRFSLTLGLRGRHQVINALTAVRIAETLWEQGFGARKKDIAYGIQRARWAGRLQMIEISKDLPMVLLDGAHNPAGAQTLRDFLEEHCREFPITLIFGAMNDKAATEMAELLFPVAQTLILTKAENPRAADAEQLVEQTKHIRQDAVCTRSLAEALTEALQQTPTDGLVVICGSLYLVGEFLAEQRRLFHDIS
ncbi:MAG TPA: folylpolyglutamate synthase/dihydrofolate synthase family protein, partial [Blastocatellia bacterium]|nr:folylpolyglutamate synthase/dihydrofolate synthase family protein [Blastocatellia bacterium]